MRLPVMERCIGGGQGNRVNIPRLNQRMVRKEILTLWPSVPPQC
jgi:hypothetical protein